ncbi:MAG TPA: HD domain-containing protein [Candidatus Saccharimonadales bacterium]|nr:HD domain-containing protein [Candidatus Saccharimonadales bacterium]
MVKLTPKIKQAIDLAAVLHLGQRRKGSGVPYVTHVYGVALILAGYSDDEDVVAAGLLHDVLEDVDGAVYGAAQMKRQFGARVYQLVRDVSDDKSLGSWRARKQGYLDHLADASPDALMISAADLIHNLTSIVEDYQTLGPQLWQRFNAPLADLHWFWATRITLIKARLDSPIVQDLETVYQAVQQLES